MLVCTKCNSQLVDGAKFCGVCGSQVEQNQRNGNISEGFSSMENAPAVETPMMQQQIPVVETVAPQKKKKFPKIIFIAAIAVIALAALIYFGTTMLGGQGNKDDIVLYLKSGEISYSSSKKVNPTQLTSDISDSALGEYRYGLQLAVTISEDGKLIFYPDKASSSDSSYPLFYAYIGNARKEPERIDTDVISYVVNEKANQVIYIKGDRGDLYRSDLKEKERIAREVEFFQTNKAGDRILYISDGDIYLKEGQKDAVKIDSDASIAYISEGLDLILYTKDDTLYKSEIGKERERIDKDVLNVIKAYDTGEIYYVKMEENDFTLMDYVEDDMKEKDAAIVEPEEPEYDVPDYSDYESYEEYEEVYMAWIEEYEKAYEIYEDEYEEYVEKMMRDWLREDLEDYVSYLSKYILYYYDGKTTEIITDAYDMDRAFASEKPVLLYSSYSQEGIEKVRLSDIEWADEVEEMVEEALFTSVEMFVAVGAESQVLEHSEGRQFVLNSEGTVLYFLDDFDDRNDTGDLYKAEIAKGKKPDPKKQDEEVSSLGGARFINVNEFMYFKNVKDSYIGVGELFINGTAISEDVKLYPVSYSESTKNLVYFTDWSERREYGTLNVYNNGTATKIEEEVYTYVARETGEIAYLYDYNINRLRGDLYIYDGSANPKKIDENVEAILTVQSFTSGRRY